MTTRYVKFQTQIRDAQADSQKDGDRDIWYLVKAIAEAYHEMDLSENEGKTRSDDENWSTAKQFLYEWGVHTYGQRGGDDLGESVHGLLNKMASPECSWDRARRLLAEEILEYHFPAVV